MNLTAQYAKNGETFEKLLKQRRYWMPHSKEADAQSFVLFDAIDQFCAPKSAQVADFFKKNDFFKIFDSGENYVATVFSKNKSLWRAEDELELRDLQGAIDFVSNVRWGGVPNWKVPLALHLLEFAKSPSNPFRYSECENRLFDEYGWLSSDCRRLDLDFDTIESDDDSGYLFAVNDCWVNKTFQEISNDLLTAGWTLRSLSGNDRVQCSDELVNIEPCVLMDGFCKSRLVLSSYPDQEVTIDPATFLVLNQLEAIDHTPCRLPKLDISQIQDPENGLWELWGNDKESLKRFHCVARDPMRDIQKRAVAIDFGTSSTVVAVNTPNGSRELLRIGLRDFFEEVRSQHFENPTVIECLDFATFDQAWSTEVYRPALNWDWMRASHEAQANFRDNPGETSVLASILPRLKQWALRSERARVRLTDRKGFELELQPHAERNPVRGQAMQPSAAPFDPIELYAWYLGMTINWRGRGLFLTYYLSFPVKYEREVKDRILASFRRGLQRSLPATLMASSPEVLSSFEVSDLASEPAAYAAAAMPELGVDPTEEGVPYAVFDFGGGDH